MLPRWSLDTPTVVPSKPMGARIQKHKPAEKPEKIEEMLRNPQKRQHVGPCCTTRDGKIRGFKKWGDGKGCEALYGGARLYECMGCRELLTQPDDDGFGVDDEAAAAALEKVENKMVAAAAAAGKRVCR